MRGVVYAVILLVTILSCHGDEIRPLYIAGFMANSIEDVDAYIAAGANVVEADLTFDLHSGRATEFYKGTLCDCFRLCHKRESVINYLEHIKEITTPGHPKFKASFTGIVIISTQLQTTYKHGEAGKDMANILDKYLFSNENNAKVVFDVAHPNYWTFVDSLVENLRARQRGDILRKIGVVSNAGENSYSEFIEKAGGTDLGLWMGDGISNCLEDFFHLDNVNVKEACLLRDEGRGVSKVIRWTVGLKKNIRNALWFGVDVIGTDDVDDVLYVMKEGEFKGRYRPATPDDDLFARIKGKGPYRYGCQKASIFHHSYICWKDTTIEGHWCKVNEDCTNNKSGCSKAFGLPCL
ncbi:dermonecrotic toxin LsaSicTox-alphaIB2i-like [Lineus longissimus]|uniref:dermonecrotic toxin LsaSicTox-alphaIB2i-like n=1 Tax=Lineus longissimus TaxID=88925 RepID=UPI00315DBE30